SYREYLEDSGCPENILTRVVQSVENLAHHVHSPWQDLNNFHPSVDILFLRCIISIILIYLLIVHCFCNLGCNVCLVVLRRIQPQSHRLCE
ncbi:hypothetical protein PENTCL1PPCAC_19487, partial [Pristionchus entomophagus]